MAARPGSYTVKVTVAEPDAATPRVRRRRPLWVDLTSIALVTALLLAGLGVGSAALYRQLYSPTAFVLHYLSLLSDGRAGDALAVPGVALTPDQLSAAGLPSTASSALLRSTALGQLSDVNVVSESSEGAVTTVTVSYSAGGHSGTTAFRVAPGGQLGVLPTWRFATSPLAVMSLTALGTMQFGVNGFVVDKRQVSPDGENVKPTEPIAMLVFSPALYAIRIDTDISSSSGTAVLTNAPGVDIPVTVQAQPTAQFTSVVQQRVNEFLSQCATQQVLQPTGCPFGYVVRNRVEGTPTWSITQQPTIQVVPDGNGWRIPDTAAVAHIQVTVQSLYDGSVRRVSDDVPFTVNAGITVNPDETVAISIGGGTN